MSSKFYKVSTVLTKIMLKTLASFLCGHSIVLIRYDTRCFTCCQKLTVSQLSHRTGTVKKNQLHKIYKLMSSNFVILVNGDALCLNVQMFLFL